MATHRLFMPVVSGSCSIFALSVPVRMAAVPTSIAAAQPETIKPSSACVYCEMTLPAPFCSWSMSTWAVAAARICLPRSRVRLSAGREDMSEEMQALCFLAGANSIFYGEKLLTTPNPDRGRDAHLMQKLGLRPTAS